MRAAKLILRHIKLERTVRYLGIDVDDALETDVQTEVQYVLESRRQSRSSLKRLSAAAV